MQCIGTCTSAVNTEQLRYKVTLVVPDPLAADIECIIENYLPAYLRVDVVLAKAVYKTSKPYPVEHIDGITSKLTIGNAGDIFYLEKSYEQVKTSLTIVSAILTKDLLDPVVLESEKICSSFSINTAEIKSLLMSTSISPESIVSSFSIEPTAKLETILITNKLQRESITSTFTIDSMILE